MKIFKFRHSAQLILVTITSIFFLIKCVDREEKKLSANQAINYNSFAGSAKCANCHQNIYDQYVQTSHFQTSQIANEKNVKGSFAPGTNRYVYNPLLYIEMEQKNNSLFQTAFYKGMRKISERFDITIGASIKGQSYMFWKKNKLFQMPITYFTFANQWVNSPGYPNKVQFNRPITSRCLECHTTYAEIIPGSDSETEEFGRNRLVLGIGCEKCHGPSMMHVSYEEHHLNEKKGKFVINPSKFSRQQSLDLCALCHGGRLEKSQPSFSFISGDKLSNFFKLDSANINASELANIDVHGNQYGLLKLSKCFRQTAILNCNTCHKSHENERGNVALFSQRCMLCHNKEHDNFCTIKFPQAVLKSNCIDCHMPVQPSRAIVLFSSGKEAPKAATFRSHFISIDKSQTEIFLKQMGKTGLQNDKKTF